MDNCSFLIVGLVGLADMARFVWGTGLPRTHTGTHA